MKGTVLLISVSMCSQLVYGNTIDCCRFILHHMTFHLPLPGGISAFSFPVIFYIDNHIIFMGTNFDTFYFHFHLHQHFFLNFLRDFFNPWVIYHYTVQFPEVSSFSYYLSIFDCQFDSIVVGKHILSNFDSVKCFEVWFVDQDMTYLGICSIGTWKECVF